MNDDGKAGNLYTRIAPLLEGVDHDVLSELAALIEAEAHRRYKAERAATIGGLVATVPIGNPATLLRHMLTEGGESTAGYLSEQTGIPLAQIGEALTTLERAGRVSIRHGMFEPVWPRDVE